MPVFPLDKLAEALAGLGYPCRPGDLRADVRPDRRLSNRDGFVTMETGNINYIGIEEVVRMGPFFNVYFLIENDSLADNDMNAHNMMDASPYYQLHNGRPSQLGWSGGVLAALLTQDAELAAELAKNIVREEAKRINVRARDYCCVIETGAWDPAGIASVFGIVDRIGAHARKLLKQVHYGEGMEV
ncbi:MAG: hypothetical protein C4292_02040 [Nitrososphaera sp.]